MFGAGLPNTASGRLPRAVMIGAAIDPAPAIKDKGLITCYIIKDSSFSIFLPG